MPRSRWRCRSRTCEGAQKKKNAVILAVPAPEAQRTSRAEPQPMCASCYIAYDGRGTSPEASPGKQAGPETPCSHVRAQDGDAGEAVGAVFRGLYERVSEQVADGRGAQVLAEMLPGELGSGTLRPAPFSARFARVLVLCAPFFAAEVHELHAADGHAMGGALPEGGRAAAKEVICGAANGAPRARDCMAALRTTCTTDRPLN